MFSLWLHGLNYDLEMGHNEAAYFDDNYYNCQVSTLYSYDNICFRKFTVFRLNVDTKDQLDLLQSMEAIPGKVSLLQLLFTQTILILLCFE